jgi:hypothetical protein
MQRLPRALGALLVLGYASCGAVRAGESDAGTFAFAFLKVAQTARLVGMGGYATADASDAAAFQTNPAGLSQQRARYWSASYSNLYTDLQSGFVSYSQPLESETVVGLALTYLTSGNIPKRDAANNDLGVYGFTDLAFTAAIGTRLVGGPDTLAPELRRRFGAQEWKVDGGLAVRLIYEQLDDLKASGLAADFGVLAHLPDDRTHVGVSVTNLGKQTDAFVNEKDGLPTSIQAGFRHRLREAPLAVVGDVAAPTDSKIRFGVGGEFLLGAQKNRPAPLALRLGFNSQGRDLRTTSDDSNIAGFSAGAGIRHRQFMLDYAFTPGLGLGTLHRFTLSGRID